MFCDNINVTNNRFVNEFQLEENMSHYMNIWFFVLCATILANVAATFFEDKKWTLKFIVIIVEIVALIIWNLTPRLYNLHISTIFVILLVWACCIVIPQKGMDLFMDGMNTFVAAFVGVIVILGFFEPYPQWYTENFGVEVEYVDPTIKEYTIPEETDPVRLPNGLDYYQISVYKDVVNKRYELQFFVDNSVETGERYDLIYRFAKDVKLLPKKPEEPAYVVITTHAVTIIDPATDMVLNNRSYDEYTFYVPEEVAEKYNHNN